MLLNCSCCYFAAVSLLLHIDTAVVGASLCLSDGDTILATAENGEQKQSASWLQPAIRQLCAEQAISLLQLKAISVSAGPGSYTGLRVGMATAKGLCYALNIPMITISTLQMMAAAAQPAEMLLCPMIDARRMEVFTAVYALDLQEILPSRAVVLNENSFADLLNEQPVLFFGNGSEKFNSLAKSPNAHFKNITATAKNLVPLALTAFQKGGFADLAYSEPIYGKAFFSPPSKPLI
ncbi:MAG: tsaB [Flaviaesturariibacter sp.]|nr:tsaB [Flaviaesturariibacter sp.]